MFTHIFRFRLTTLLRDRADLFWTLIYPIVLAIFFSLAFANLSSADKFTSFGIAVVDNDEYQSQPYFIAALHSVSDEATSPEDTLFEVTLMTEEQAAESLINNGIIGYILFEDGAHVIVKSSGIQQTILKGFVDSFLQQSSAVATILHQNPAGYNSVQMGSNSTYIKAEESVKSDVTSVVIMYYGLISMAVMFGGFWGRREVEDIQADMSVQGARLNLAPVHKLKAFVYSLSASLVIQILSLLILVAFMFLVLGVNFGNQIGYIILTCIVSGIMGVTFGAFLAAIIRGSAGLRMAIMLTVSLLSSAIAGMVNQNLKYAVTQAVPILQYINPANLVSDAFYALYFYGAGGRFTLNILLMLAFSVVFAMTVYLVTRRQKYASL